MSKLKSFSVAVAATAFPNRRDGDYGIDIASIIAMVELIATLCDLAPEELAERAHSMSLRDRARVWMAARESGVPWGKRRSVVSAFVQCCDTTPEADLVEGIKELQDV